MRFIRQLVSQLHHRLFQSISTRALNHHIQEPGLKTAPEYFLVVERQQLAYPD